MRRHLKYLSYVVRHKWFVLLAGLEVGAPIYRLIIHDWSKFLPSEWSPYARTFYAPNGDKQYVESVSFNTAWNFHQKRNKHHWQYWVLNKDDGKVVPLKMPRKYVSEMVADWAGAGKAITGKWEVAEWYEKNKEKIIFHEETRLEVEFIIEAVFN